MLLLRSALCGPCRYEISCRPGAWSGLVWALPQHRVAPVPPMSPHLEVPKTAPCGLQGNQRWQTSLYCWQVRRNPQRMTLIIPCPVCDCLWARPDRRWLLPATEHHEAEWQHRQQPTP